jgi:hypothetical protein
MVQNRDIPTKTIYHWQLKRKPGSAGTTDITTKQLDALQASAVFLRTVDLTAREGIEHLKTNQASVYNILRDLVKNSQLPAQEAVITYRDTVGESNSDGMKMVALINYFKGMESETKNVCDAYREASTINALKEADREDELRGQLQNALFHFARATGRLDEALTRLANEWDVVGDTGVKLAGFSLPVFDSSKGAEEAKADAPAADDKTPPNRPKKPGKPNGKKGAKKNVRSA